jgi:hypothetical protein
VLIDGLRFGIYHGTSVKLKGAAVGSKMYDVLSMDIHT